MSYYHGMISSKKASALLNRNSPGCFLIRDSQSQPGNFVLSAKSSDRVYHILILKRGKYYSLDVDEPASGAAGSMFFRSLDELVHFCTSHQLQVDGNSMCLQSPLRMESTEAASSAKTRLQRHQSSEDSDQLTDLFASLFGAHNSVLASARSNLSFDGQPLEDGEEFLCVLSKDLRQKEFFIRIINLNKKEVVNGKHITKNFQYDSPGECVLTYLSKHGITCVGFKSLADKEYFTRHVDRVVKQLQQDGSVDFFLKSKKPTPHPSPVRRKKASSFDINNVTPEWQYLLDIAGVTEPMLRDPATLNFILDAVVKSGGAPRMLGDVEEEAIREALKGHETAVMFNHEKECVKALAVDRALRKESQRAFRLHEQLKERNMLHDKSSPRRSSPLQVCPYLTECENFKEYLLRSCATLASQCVCYCHQCLSGRPHVGVSGSPPQQYMLPVGWVECVIRSQAHPLAKQLCSRWHVAYTAVPVSAVSEAMSSGELSPLNPPHGEVLLSPSLECSCNIASATAGTGDGFTSEITGKQYRVRTALKVYVQPKSYTAIETESASPDLLSKIVWLASSRSYIIHSLLMQLH